MASSIYAATPSSQEHFVCDLYSSTWLILLGPELAVIKNESMILECPANLAPDGMRQNGMKGAGRVRSQISNPNILSSP